MNPIRRLAAATVGVACPLALAATVLTGCGGASDGVPSRSQAQVSAARRAADWLARQVNTEGYIPTSPGGTQPNLSATAQTVFALATAGVDRAEARNALQFLRGTYMDYVTTGGALGPGQLALLILDCAAMGANPRHFGGADLVLLLLSTQNVDGPDKGLFGTETQVGEDSAGVYDQGLVLAALAAVGVRNTAPVAAGVQWLTNEQCNNGGWTLPDTAENGCDENALSGAGPDTNSTALAMQGLAAQGALVPSVVRRSVGFLRSAQRADGGWSYFPMATTGSATMDPDSTALVIQALVAAHVAPAGGGLQRAGGATPMSALLSFQLSSGGGAGAFYFPPAPSPANVIATYQAIPALFEQPFGRVQRLF